MTQSPAESTNIQPAEVDAKQATSANIQPLANVRTITNASLTNVGNVINNSTTNVDNSVTNVTFNVVVQWSSEAGFEKKNLTTEQLLQATKELEAYKEFRGMGKDDRSKSNNIPLVSAIYVELVKLVHEDPTFRNIFLDPTDPEKVLLKFDDGKKQGWKQAELRTAVKSLFDGVCTMLSKTVTQDLVLIPGKNEDPALVDLEDCTSRMGMLYREGQSECVAKGTNPVQRHLVDLGKKTSDRPKAPMSEDSAGPKETKKAELALKIGSVHTAMNTWERNGLTKNTAISAVSAVNIILSVVKRARSDITTLEKFRQWEHHDALLEIFDQACDPKAESDKKQNTPAPSLKKIGKAAIKFYREMKYEAPAKKQAPFKFDAAKTRFVATAALQKEQGEDEKSARTTIGLLAKINGLEDLTKVWIETPDVHDTLMRRIGGLCFPDEPVEGESDLSEDHKKRLRKLLEIYEGSLIKTSAKK